MKNQNLKAEIQANIERGFALSPTGNWVWILNEGNFFITPELAIADYNKNSTGNGVNHRMKEHTFQGKVYFQYIETNIWD